MQVNKIKPHLEGVVGLLTGLFFENSPTKPLYGDVFYYHRFSGTLQGVRNNEALAFSLLGEGENERIFLGQLSNDIVQQELQLLLIKLGAGGREVRLEEVSQVVRFRIR